MNTADTSPLRLPMFSIIVPVPPHMDEPSVLFSLRQLDYPPKYFEILLTRGTLPPRQRNLAAKQASGEYLVFLDDDVQIPPTHLWEILQCYKTWDSDGVGGPCLPEPNNSIIARTIAYSLSSWWAVGSLRARYQKDSPLFPADDKKFILCNQSIRRDVFLASGGFNEHLFPNEENELFERLQEKGARFGYSPSLAARRPVEHSVFFHFKKMFRYGKGRGRQTRMRFTHRSLEHGAVVLAMTILYVGICWPSSQGTIPRFLYLLWFFCAFLDGWRATRSLAVGLLTPFVVAGMHTAYSLGFWAGLVLGLPKTSNANSREITVHRYNLSGGSIR